MKCVQCLNKFLRSCMPALAMLLTLSASASRVNVFEHELGALPTGVWKDAMNQRALDLLDGNDIDFGYFNGTKNVGYFLLESDNYTVLKKGLIKNNIPSRTFFTFKTAKYEIVPLTDEADYDSEVGSNIFIAYLLRDKATLRQYLCVHAAGEKFDTATQYKITSYCKPLKTLVDRCLTAHSDARLLIFHSGSATYAKIYDQLLLYVDDPTYMGMNLLVSEESAGGLHSGTNSCALEISHAVKSTKVWDDTSADYPLVATIAYPHDVKFIDDNGTVITNAVTMDNQAAVAPPNPSKTGFDFVGWDPADFTCVTNDMTIVATYQAAAGSAIVTFKDEDETVVASKSVKTGETVSPPDEPPMKEGHTLTAWLKDDLPYDFSTPVTESFDLIASYTANVYTVTFQYEDGELIERQYVEYLEDAIEPETPAPKKAGQIFLKWDCEFTAISEDTVVTALFVDREIKVGSAEEFVEYVAIGLPAELTLVLTNDLDFTGLIFTPSDFVAKLDGNGYSIKGLTYKPLFGILSGTVRNMTIKNCAWGPTDTTATFLANTMRGAVIANCQIDGCSARVIKSNLAIGGFAVFAEADDGGNGTIFTNCVVRNSAFTTGAGSGVVVGGLVRTAKNGTLFIDCTTESTNVNAVVGGRDLVTGGIAGESICSTFVRCQNGVNVQTGYAADCFAGGIVGRCLSDNSSGSSKSSVFIACTNLAGVLNIGADGCAGGIVGSANKSDVVFQKCLNRGTIKMVHYEEIEPLAKHMAGNGLGGILGGIYYSVSMSLGDCVNYGAVNDDYVRSAGGLVGGANGNSDSAESKLFMTNCVNHGPVSGGYAVGGLIGMHGPIFGPVMVNCGNTGALSCPTGSVGGVFGILYGGRQNNTKSYTLDEYKNVMNCGAVTTESGFAGGWIGTFIGGEEIESKGNNYTLAPTNLVLTTAVIAGEGGTSSNLVANIVLRGRTVTIADEDTHYLKPDDFKLLTAKQILDGWVKSQTEYYPNWIRTKDWPDLEIFSKPVVGLQLIIR